VFVLELVEAVESDPPLPEPPPPVQPTADARRIASDQ
jgi:hypothetical protein